MKALILSGGKGTRLRPITHTSAKQLVPIANKPILHYGLESIIQAGITDIGVVVGDTAKEIEESLGDGSSFGAKITYIKQDKPLGLAHAVKTARSFIKSDPFVMYLGDNLLTGGIGTFVSDFVEKEPDAKILLAHVPNPQDFGVAELKDNRVKSLVEKPKKPKSDLALVGVYLFTEKIFEAVENIIPSARGELEITDAIQYLINTGKHVDYEVVQGWWKDTGKLDDMLEASRLVLDTIEDDMQGEIDKKSNVNFKVRIGKGTKVVRSSIHGPAVIGENCLIEDAYIGPFTSVESGAQLIGCEVENSIILKNAIIKNIDGRISESLIGRDVEITKSKRMPKVHRFMVGDASRVEVS